MSFLCYISKSVNFNEIFVPKSVNFYTKIQNGLNTKAIFEKSLDTLNNISLGVRNERNKSVCR